MKWVLMTLLVPEFVVARTAFRQFCAARALIKHLNEVDAGATDSAGVLPTHIQDSKVCQFSPRKIASGFSI